MKKIIINLLFLITCTFGKDISIIDNLMNKAMSSTNESYTALLLLTHLKLSDYEYKQLSELYLKETNTTKKLFIANTFTEHAIANYESDFIKLFPVADKQSIIIATTYDTKYIHIVSPLYDTLISLSYDNQEALYKLLSSLEFVQGSYAETIYGAIEDIYKLKPKYVIGTAKKYHINLEKFKFQPISNLSKTLDKEVIPVFNKYMELYIQDNSVNIQKPETLTNYGFGEFTKALNIFSKNYCSNPNGELLNKFIEILILTEGSAFETPSTILGEIYICQSTSIIKKIKELNKEEQKYIINNLDFGFQNVVYKKENVIKNYPQLLNQLNSLKNNINSTL